MISPLFNYKMSSCLKKKLIESNRPVGVTKQCRYELPPESWVYGMPLKKDKEDAGTSKFNYYHIYTHPYTHIHIYIFYIH